MGANIVMADDRSWSVSFMEEQATDKTDATEEEDQKEMAMFHRWSIVSASLSLPHAQ
jgi:hypothetical protein